MIFFKLQTTPKKVCSLDFLLHIIEQHLLDFQFIAPSNLEENKKKLFSFCIKRHLLSKWTNICNYLKELISIVNFLNYLYYIFPLVFQARLLHDLKAGSHRVLIFTQMTKVLDILESFLNFHGHTYMRLDGSTKVEQRQVLMER